MIITLLLSAVVFLIIVDWIRLIIGNRRCNVPGPFPLPLLGNAHLFMGSSASELLNILHMFSMLYGDAYLIHFCSIRRVFLSHPKYVEPLLSSWEFITKGQSYNLLRCWLGQGLITSTGQRWRTDRKFLTPAFHFNILQNFLPVFCKNQKVLTEKLRKLSDGKPFNVFPLVALAALDNVIDSVMGVSMDVQRQNDSKFVKSLETITTIIVMRIRIPILTPDIIFNLLPLKTKLDKALKEFNRETKKVIETRRSEIRKAHSAGVDANNDLGIKDKHSFLDLLLLKELEDGQVDEESVMDQVNNFLFAGHDTVTSGIAHTLFILSKHRDVQDKIFAELKSIFGPNINNDPNYNDLSQMKYLEMVLKESLRLYPPAPVFERLMVKDCEVGDLKLVKDTSVMINVFELHRHPDLYDNPLEFRPERFEVPLKNPFSWIPFSAGPRNCIGQKYAMMVMKVMISEVIKNFIILPSDIEPDMTIDVVIRPKNGVHIRLSERK